MFTFETLAFILLMLLTLFSLRPNKTGEILSRKNCHHLRGIFALIIIIFHVSKETDLLYPVFAYLGVTVVAAFFFISGFGLMKGYLKDPDYVKRYPWKRLVKVVFPYLIITCVYWAYLTYIQEPHTLSEILSRIVHYAPIVTYSWFLVSLIVQYLYFYVLILLFRQKRQYTYYGACLLCLITFICAVFFNYADANLFNFPFGLGILYAWNEEKVMSFIKRFAIPLSLVTAVLIAVTQMHLIPFVNGETYQLLERSLFVIALLLFLRFFSIRNTILSSFGDLSLEIYLTQGLSKMIVRRFFAASLFMQDAAIFAVFRDFDRLPPGLFRYGQTSVGRIVL